MSSAQGLVTEDPNRLAEPFVHCVGAGSVTSGAISGQQKQCVVTCQGCNAGPCVAMLISTGEGRQRSRNGTHTRACCPQSMQLKCTPRPAVQSTWPKHTRDLLPRARYLSAYQGPTTHRACGLNANQHLLPRAHGLNAQQDQSTEHAVQVCFYLGPCGIFELIISHQEKRRKRLAQCEKSKHLSDPATWPSS